MAPAPSKDNFAMSVQVADKSKRYKRYINDKKKKEIRVMAEKAENKKEKEIRAMAEKAENERKIKAQNNEEIKRKRNERRNESQKKSRNTSNAYSKIETDRLRRTSNQKERRKIQVEQIETKRAKFSDTQTKSDISFANFEIHPETAVMLYHMNCGYEKFRGLDDLESPEQLSSDESMEIINKLKEEIQNEVPTPEELNKICTDYLTKQGRGNSSFKDVKHNLHELSASTFHTKDTLIATCGSCGYRDAERGEPLTHVMLSSLNILAYTQSQVDQLEREKCNPALNVPSDNTGGTMDLYIYKLKSYYESTNLEKHITFIQR
jgi:hypothetical protein